MSGKHANSIDLKRIALGVHQPWAELILRGVKTIELRRSNTTRLERIYLYATKQIADPELANNAVRKHQLSLDRLPRGLIVGTVDITGARKAHPKDASAACVPKKYSAECYAWELANPARFEEPIPAEYTPYGTWFYPFQRKKRQLRLIGRRKK